MFELGLAVVFTIVICGGYWAAVSTFADHRGEFHSLIGGGVIAGAVALAGAPWWFAVAVFIGAAWGFVQWSRATYAREQQELLAWRQQAVAELGMRDAITPYHACGLNLSRTLVQGIVGGVRVTVRRDVSGSDVGPSAWYSVELKSGSRRQYENLDEKILRDQVFREVKRVLAAFNAAAD